MKLELGKRYVRRDGQITEPLVRNTLPNSNQESYPYHDPSENGYKTYTPQGAYFIGRDGSAFDLIAEYAEEEEPPSPPHDGKADQGKLRASILRKSFPHAMTALAQVSDFGAKKYCIDGWRSVPDGINRYEDAAERHALARLRGEKTDPESTLPHRAHEIWDQLAILELELLNELTQNQ